MAQDTLVQPAPVAAAPPRTGLLLRVIPSGSYAGRAKMLVGRAFLVNRRAWLTVVSGFFEPVFYLLALGVGFGKLVSHVVGPGGVSITYSAFVAPALLAASAMNGAVFDSTFNIFHKLKYVKLYDSILATPLGPVDIAIGEICWALIRGGFYAFGFLIVMTVMGLITSPWALLALPAALLIALGFASVGMAATTFMRSWQDFDLVNLAVLPMFFFSTTFYPLSVYPGWLRVVVQCFPLYHGVALMRALTTGFVGWDLLGHALYFAVMAGFGMVLAGRRLRVLLLK
ncbi:MAG TPA: ABC transporter permease [Pseudonocardiaceae bacterium]|jgi:lipooligosaccharide transport system permease protein|nr:ABC transporter permease [Pseudonocardiaceae bacterium]